MSIYYGGGYFPDYFFSDRCLMAPFYLVIQIVRALYDSDLFYSATLLEEFETYHEPFLSGRLVKALLHMEKDEMKDAEKKEDIDEQIRINDKIKNLIHTYRT